MSCPKVKVYWSYTQFPELSGYSPQEKKVIWLNLSQWKEGSEPRSWTGFGIAIVISIWLFGMLLGGFNSRDVDRGCVIGGLTSLAASVPVIFFLSLVNINSRRKLLQQYLASKDFSLTPINDQVRALLDPFGRRPSLESPESSSAWGAAPDLSDMEHVQPVARYVHLALFMAVQDKAKTIAFSLEDESSERGFKISYAANGTTHQMQPAPGSLFAPVVTVLCTYASIPYYAKGPVKGELCTRRPDSRWCLQSDDLRKHVLLSKART